MQEYIFCTQSAHLGPIWLELLGFARVLQRLVQLLQFDVRC